LIYLIKSFENSKSCGERVKQYNEKSEQVNISGIYSEDFDEEE
jgi:hypothetical protein